MLLLSTGSLYTKPIAQVFTWAQEAGFDGVELLVDRRPETRDRRHIQSCMKQTALPVPVVHVPFHSQPTAEWGTDSVDRVLATAALAQELGARLVVVHLPLWRERRFARWLLEELPTAENRLELVLAVENLPAKRWLRLVPHFRRWPFLFREQSSQGPLGRLLTAISHPDRRLNTAEELARFGHVVFDTTHWARRGDVSKFWARLKGRVAHIHIANYAAGRGHRLPWDGEIDMCNFLNKVQEDGYGGHLTAELCPRALGDPDEEVVRNRLSEVAAWLRSAWA